MAEQHSPAFDFQSVLTDARRMLTNPTGFYRDMPTTGGFTEPLWFIVVIAVATGIVGAFLSLFGGSQIGAMRLGFASIIIVPILAAFTSFISAAVLHLIWRLMGSDRSYETAYRCVAYATAIYPVIAIVGVIPYLATIIGMAWLGYLMIEASVLVHDQQRKTATLVFGLFAVLLMLSNIGSERVTRKLELEIRQFSHHMEEWRNLSPEEAGRRMGECLRDLEDSMHQNQR